MPRIHVRLIALFLFVCLPMDSFGQAGFVLSSETTGSLQSDQSTFESQAFASRMTWVPQFWQRFLRGRALRAAVLAMTPVILAGQIVPQPEKKTLPPQNIESAKPKPQNAIKERSFESYKRFVEEELAGSPTINYLKAKDRIRMLAQFQLSREPFQFSQGMHRVQSVDDFFAAQVSRKQLFTAYRFKGQPIFLMRFASESVQGLAFDRLAIFVEVQPGKIMNEEELWRWSLTGKPEEAGGHDYKLTDVANFFTTARRLGIPLNVIEIRLREELLSAGLLVLQQSQYRAPMEGALASIAMGVGTKSGLAHELNHAIYFTDRAYREKAKTLWRSPETARPNEKLTSAEKIVAHDILEAMKTLFPYNFDSDEDLLVREFMAYFRDYDELSRYGDTWSKQVGQEKIPDILKPYFKSSKVFAAFKATLKTISQKVNALDRYSEAYRSLAAFEKNSPVDRPSAVGAQTSFSNNVAPPAPRIPEASPKILWASIIFVLSGMLKDMIISQSAEQRWLSGLLHRFSMDQQRLLILRQYDMAA